MILARLHSDGVIQRSSLIPARILGQFANDDRHGLITIANDKFVVDRDVCRCFGCAPVDTNTSSVANLLRQRPTLDETRYLEKLIEAQGLPRALLQLVAWFKGRNG